MGKILGIVPSLFSVILASNEGGESQKLLTDPGWKSDPATVSLHQRLAQYIQQKDQDFTVTWHPMPPDHTTVIFQRFYASSARVTYTWHQGKKIYHGYAHIHMKQTRQGTTHKTTTPYWAERQQSITVLYQSADLSLKLQGLKALKPGKKGEVIPVLNPKTQQKIWVTLVAPGVGHLKEETGL